MKIIAVRQLVSWLLRGLDLNLITPIAHKMVEHMFKFLQQFLQDFNPLQPGVAFIYPLKTSGGIEKQHWTVVS